ncbi:MAG: hypothetical protein V4654_10360 [Bdellovibrionota bacterium]
MKQLLKILFLGCVILGCQIKTERGDSPDDTSTLGAESTARDKLKKDPRQDERYSLVEDRAKFDQLRKDIPIETKIRNDEKALYMEWMAEYKRDPSDIRSKFSALTMKKRENFNKDMNKIRDQYSKEESKKKDVFNKELAEQRNEIKDQKVTREKRTEMYSEIDGKRKDFYAQLREDRDSFETDYRQKRKDFEEYIKEKSDIFYAELKEYTVKYNELKKAKGK